MTNKLDDAFNLDLKPKMDYKSSLDRLVSAVNIFKGYIYGEFVSLYYLESNIFNSDIKLDFENINIILNNYNDCICLIRLLHNIFEIHYDRNSKINNYKIVIDYNYNNTNYSVIKNLNLYNNVSVVDLNYYTYFLDINLLSLNLNGLEIINYNNKNNIEFTKILNRIIYKKFSFIDGYNSNIFYNIERAIKLLHNGWIMDDYYLKKDTSVLFYWKHRDMSRIHYNEKEKKMMCEDNKCSICTSDFKNDDLVINTKCNHNFHWDCNYYSDYYSEILSTENNLENNPEDNNTENNTENNPEDNNPEDNNPENENDIVSSKISGIKNWIINFSDKCPICRCEYCI